jgi:serine/threonine protein kinase
MGRGRRSRWSSCATAIGSCHRLLGAPMEVERFLGLAIGIATALRKLHQRGLIHKDIKPANVLVNEATGEVRLTGFGIASRLSRERQAPEPPEALTGTLAYMAPEQTGRMNRSIDSRSDLYALGVTVDGIRSRALTAFFPSTMIPSSVTTTCLKFGASGSDGYHADIPACHYW